MAELRPKRSSKGPWPRSDPTIWTLLAAPRAASAARSTSAGDLFSRPLVAAVVPLAGGPVAGVPPAIGWQAVAPLAGGPVAVVPLAGGPVAVAGPPHALAATVRIAASAAAAVSAKAQGMWFMVFFPSSRPALAGADYVRSSCLPGAGRRLVPRPAMFASWVVPAGRGNGTPNAEQARLISISDRDVGCRPGAAGRDCGGSGGPRRPALLGGLVGGHVP